MFVSSRSASPGSCASADVSNVKFRLNLFGRARLLPGGLPGSLVSIVANVDAGLLSMVSVLVVGVSKA